MTSNIAPELIWPHYEVGPHKIVFAIGVVSINFARFERVITWMVAATTGCEETEAETILRPLPPAEKLRRLKTVIEGRRWPQLGIVGTAFFGIAVVGGFAQFSLGLVIELLVLALGLPIFLPKLVGTPDNIHHFWAVVHRPRAFE